MPGFGNRFSGRVVLDGLDECQAKFLGCMLVVRGERPFTLVDCTFENCSYAVDGAAAIALRQFGELGYEVRPVADRGRIKTLGDRIEALLPTMGNLGSAVGGAAGAWALFKGRSKKAENSTVAEVTALLAEIRALQGAPSAPPESEVQTPAAPPDVPQESPTPTPKRARRKPRATKSVPSTPPKE